MPLTKEQIKTAAMQLDPAEREALAEELLLSISESERQEIDTAWLAESHRRYQAFLKGEEEAAPNDEVVAQIRNSARR
jgi:putative addiction module component (TIGR02574 family)